MTGIWNLLTWLVGPEPRPERGDELVKCPTCRAEAVSPVAWEHEGVEWRTSLRCGNCGHREEVTLDDEQARELDRALDRGVHQIARTVTRLERRRMLAEAEALSVALEHDLIGADDFAHRSVER
ncbi:MAG TPA: hypothetical protein VFP78_02525 [Solirubrobacteraceae bacterium]|nr:hypothetical protein [Solirubrobacteraceae bacterium]